MIEKFRVSRDDAYFHGWPDVAAAKSGRLVCVFAECVSHADRSHTRLMLCHSDDRGRTWSAKRPLTKPRTGDGVVDPFWNCPRITAFDDGRLAVVADRIAGAQDGHSRATDQSVWMWISTDRGETWSERVCIIQSHAIVPDRIVELKRGPAAGQFVLCAHTTIERDGKPVHAVRCWRSSDRGVSWEGPATVAEIAEMKLCEGSIVEMPKGELVCFMRENSHRGFDLMKSISRDGGLSWQGPIRMPIPAAHRPCAGILQGGKVLITHRYMPGGQMGVPSWSQNLFAAYTDAESCLSPVREGASARILPLDYDRSPVADTGYSGWTQLPDGEIYVVNYIVDDAPKAQIRGYALRESDIVKT